MKLGLNTAILGHMTFEEVIIYCNKVGYECVEVACWPSGKAERRYAGVSHIDVSNLDDDAIQSIHDLCHQYHVEISALAYYPNAMDENLKGREASINHLKKVIVAANRLKINMVTTFVGRMRTKSTSENLALFAEIWPPIVAFAKEHNVKLAVENCPMLFSEDEWPGGQNLFTSPAIWRQCFEIINDEYFGINYDPSHFVWQQIDYLKPLYEFSDKIFHIHFKDIKLYKDRLDDVGIMAPPLSYMTPKLPGLGDVNWGQYVAALLDIGYHGYACVEVEDRCFEDSTASIEKSCELSYRYLRQYVI